MLRVTFELLSVRGSTAVMAGLDPAIHESNARRDGVDARDKRGHDAGRDGEEAV